MSYLQELRVKREEYLAVRNHLYTAINKANFLKGQISTTAGSLEEGVVLGGEGFDEGKLTAFSENMGTIANTLSTIADFYSAEISSLSEEIAIEESKLNSLSGGKENTSSQPNLLPGKPQMIQVDLKD